jgi:4-hydroxy-tetrahydrodipicolinate synthase
MVTPFKDDGEVDYDQAQHLARALIDGGNDGLVITGTTGEAPTLTTEEKLGLYRAVKQAVGDSGKVLAGTSSYNTKESVELSLEAQDCGVDGFLLVVPYYNRPNQEGIYRHFEAIANAVDLPCILYNIPSRTGRLMETETLVRASQIPNVVGVKDAAGNLDATATLVSKAAPGFKIWSGDDSYTLPLLSIGGYGVISTCANIVPRQMKEMIETFVAGRIEDASARHRGLLPMMSALMTIGPNPIPIKHAMNKVGFPVGGVRLPLFDLDDAESRKLMAEVTCQSIDLPVGAAV